MTEPNESDINAAAQRWSDSVGTRLIRPLTPIYREGHRHPELIGTGILIRVDDLIFLVSAAHVVEQARGGPHYFSANDEMINLPSLRLTSPLPLGGPREDDRTDLGYWVMDPDKARQVTSADTLTLAELDPAPVAPDAVSPQYFVNGYPASRQPRRIEGNEFGAKPFAFMTDDHERANYVAAGLDLADHLLVDFDKADVFREGKRVSGPDLFGVSGGAIWRLGGRLASPDQPRLAAIITSWRRGAQPGIVASRIHVWIASASMDFPNQFQRAIEALRSRHSA